MPNEYCNWAADTEQMDAVAYSLRPFTEHDAMPLHYHIFFSSSPFTLPPADLMARGLTTNSNLSATMTSSSNPTAGTASMECSPGRDRLNIADLSSEDVDTVGG